MIFLSTFKSISPESLSDNTFKLIAKDWTLIAAGDTSSYNMMTANWLGLGYLWMKNVAFLFIRPTRYTYEFTEKLDTLSLNFFTDEYRNILNLCGKESGRDINKMNCGLSPMQLSDGGIAFNEARLVLNCKKLAVGDMSDFDFIDKAPLKWYDEDSYHKIYICEIKEILIKE